MSINENHPSDPAKSPTHSATWLKRVQYVAAVAGALLVGAWLVAWVHGSVLSRRDVARFEAVRSQRVMVRQIEPAEVRQHHPVETSLWSPERVEGYRESLFEDFDLPLAVLRVPAVDIEAPVLPGTDELTLNRGVGWIDGTASPGDHGNFAVAGHRDGFFRGLKDIQLGDEIEVETLVANFTYVIDNLTVVDPSDVWVLEPRDESSVTLVTCYPFYFVGSAPNRFIVQASLRAKRPTHQKNTRVNGPGADSGS